jgi:hypothetical protein
MTQPDQHRMPTTDHPLNGEPRPTLGPLILTLLIVAGIVGVLALTISGITH